MIKNSKLYILDLLIQVSEGSPEILNANDSFLKIIIRFF